MRAAYLLLISLTAAVPAIVLIDSPIVHDLIMAYLAVALAITAVGIRPGEAAHLATVIRAPLLAATIPALLMTVQLSPLPPAANPAWESTTAALGHAVAGSISIDPGATLLALAHYLSFVAVALLAAAVTVDRGRAERLLDVLTCAATAVAVALILDDVFGLGGLGGRRLEALDISVLGAILAVAAGDRAYERIETRGVAAACPLGLTLGVAIAGLACCALAVVRASDPNATLALACGLAVFGAIVVMRRLGLGPVGSLGVGAIATAVCAVIVGGRLAGGGPDLAVAFSDAGADLFAATSRMLVDATRLGTGAGTFGDLIGMYGNIATPGAPAPSAAAALVIEWGRPPGLVLLVTVLLGLVALFAAAMRRGRDSFYPAAGAAALGALALLAFGNSGVLGWGASIVAGVTLGLALAQSRSRSLQ